MKRIVALPIVALVAWATASLSAQETAYGDYVRALRAKGYADLALEAIDRYFPRVPANQRPALELERILARRDLRMFANGSGERKKSLDQAMIDLERIMRERPQRFLAGVAQLERGRCLASQFRDHTDRGFLLRELVEGPGELIKAYDCIVQARRDTGEALETIQAEWAKQGKPDKLQPIVRDARLFHARVRLELASTYGPLRKSLKERSELVVRAVADLEFLAAEDQRDPLCWEAAAWEMRAYQIIEDHLVAKKFGDVLFRSREEAAESGRRLVEFFRFQEKNDPRSRTPRSEIISLGNVWLERYCGPRHTQEEIAVRYTLAEAYLREGWEIGRERVGAKTVLRPKARVALSQAQDMYKSLKEAPGELADDARTTLPWLEKLLTADDVTKLLDNPKLALP